MISLADAARQVLLTRDPMEKSLLTAEFAQQWRGGIITETGRVDLPDRPGRPDKPELHSPARMPKRGKGGLKGRIGLLHALAHIELNAIDLAWDIAARFPDENMPRDFYDDWVQIADDEAKHFRMLTARLGELGACYGDLPAHDGLWQSSMETAYDLLARLAVVPMVFEARGLDATPPTVERLIASGDTESAEILRLIAAEEIAHVAAGRKYYEMMCDKRGLPYYTTWHALLRKHLRGPLRPPFNDAARYDAGMPPDYYQDYVLELPDENDA
ncbi:ferritin-like domain-containing protein [Thalassospira sp.]|uniref:ferritin-like domain-containing protein n=1 Tax=Thalassospira sp. TaxID=1912094 RepID=UPI0027366189|nr:ferritin-like domain-containing protein [Thalassospira sp.]MDP2700128.1 ferritin-like domain-containing protein [Thalassospira sp.]